jgi:uncharacterized protein YkwD
VKLKLVNSGAVASGQNGAEVQLSEATFGREFNEALIHQVVTLTVLAVVPAVACAAPPADGSRGSAPAPAPTPAEPEPIGTPGDPAERLLAAVNRERTRRDLAPLALDRRLAAAAEEHSRAMAERGFLAHCDLDSGGEVGDRADRAGYPWRAVAENLSVGRATAREVVEGWLDSPSHRRNLLSPLYRDAGVGYVHDPADSPGVRVDDDGDCEADRRSGPYRHSWTIVLGSTRAVAPLPAPPPSP